MKCQTEKGKYYTISLKCGIKRTELIERVDVLFLGAGGWGKWTDVGQRV